MGKRVLLTGSRDWDDAQAILRVLLSQMSPEDDELPTLVHGACRTGADRMAAQLAYHLGWTVEPHAAEWARFGASAGPIRNALMVLLGADVCIAFIRDASSGSVGCVKMAEKAGIPVIVTVDNRPVVSE